MKVYKDNLKMIFLIYIYIYICLDKKKKKKKKRVGFDGVCTVIRAWSNDHASCQRLNKNN